MACLHEFLNCSATTPNLKQLGRKTGEMVNVPSLNVSLSSAISIIAGALRMTETSQALQKLDFLAFSAFLHAIQPFWPNLQPQVKFHSINCQNRGNADARFMGLSTILPKSSIRVLIYGKLAPRRRTRVDGRGNV